MLSFWIGLDKSVWDDKLAADFAHALAPYPSKLLTLGIFNSEPPESLEEPALKSLPFIPVFNAYGFHNKYHITTIPTIIVIDKTGHVMANLQGAESMGKLKQVLATVMQ